MTSGSVNSYRVRFGFSADWTGLDRAAVFKYGSNTWTVLLDERNECAVPWEALLNYGRPLYAGVYGTKGGQIVLPTVWASLGTVLEGVRLDGDAAMPPTPGLADQLLDKLHGKGDGLSYDGGKLSLLSGEKELSSVHIASGEGGSFAFANEEDILSLFGD